MAKQTINIGTTANDRTGDPLRTAFTKINQNFTELYNKDATDFSGSYNDLSNKPDLSVYQLANTAFSGDYDDLDNKPTIPSDLSDLTDTTNIIPSDLSDLTDTTNIIPSDVSDLTDNTRTIERKYSIIRKNYVVKNKASTSIADGELIPQDLAENYVSSTENTRVLNFSTESANNGSFASLFENAIYNKQSFELFITDYQGNDDVFFTKDVSYISSASNNYRGYNASFATIYNTGRTSINQIVITTETTVPNTSITQTDNDDFTVSSIDGSETVAVISIFRGSDDPVGRGQLWEFFKEYVDLVLYTGDTENDTATIKTRFYQNIESLKSKVPVLYPDFQFYANTAVTANSSIVTGGSGSGAAFSLLTGRYEGESWRNGSLLDGGTGYDVGDTLTILGTELGGTSNNNVSILISGVDGSGVITEYTISGTAINVWPTNSISNGGSFQYDPSGNVINTNISGDIAYNDGNPVPSSGTGSTPFGSASSYVTLYKDSIFSMVAKDADVTDVYFSGVLGFDESLSKDSGELEGVIGYKVQVGGLSVAGNWVEDRTYTVSYSYAGYDFPRTLAGSITNTNITNWNTAYSWGNHLLAGYYRNPADLVDLEDLIPADDSVYDLGSIDRQWRSLYVSANTIFIGGTPVTVAAGNLFVGGSEVGAIESVSVSNNFTITVGETNTWEFNASGNIILPNGAEIRDVGGDLRLRAVPGEVTQLQGIDASGFVDSAVKAFYNSGSYVTINTNIDAGSPEHIWIFDYNGDLTVPNYINFDGGTFIGDEPGAGSPVFRMVAPLGYGATIETDSDIEGNNYVWTFNATGELNLPGKIILDNGAQIFGTVGLENSITIGATATNGTTTFNGSGFFIDDVYFNKAIQEKFTSLQDATGVVTHDCANSHIFYHTSPDANWTVNLTNFSLVNNYTTAVTIIIAQGGTGYYPSALQIGGAAQTINWQGNTTPSPSSNRVDVVTFSIFRTGAGYTVLGQLVGF